MISLRAERERERDRGMFLCLDSPIVLCIFEREELSCLDLSMHNLRERRSCGRTRVCSCERERERSYCAWLHLCSV